MSRARKKTEFDAYKAGFADIETVVVTHYSGMSVAEMTNLRNKLREGGASFKVTKNSLVKRALQGTQFEGVADMFTGPVGMATSQDPVAAAKIIHEFCKENDKLKIVGGAMGATILDAKGVEALAKMPSLDELRGMLVGLLVTPARQIATIMQAPASQMARVISAKAEKGE
ncbi:MAG: 50S ribosomal protein L10 [Rhodospirillales bacterium]|nr:50S ribosomal protein L10 [Rhodospirillales bacterium]MCB9965695.1 50S ribosomal protein L10 [Rhodospirillales bacterium]MCB9980102.1 50S ribosomal protein L10 [Rhodospirillales bacterium]